MLLTACGTSVAPGCGQLRVAHPWVRAAPPGATTMAAYLTLLNDGDTRVNIHGVSSSQFERAELHRTLIDANGQAHMQPLRQVTVDSGATVAFEPTGRHVMLFDPSQRYAPGDQVELILACGSRGAELPVAAVVRSARPGLAGEQAPLSGDGGNP